jgi:hypothetical protein
MTTGRGTSWFARAALLAVLSVASAAGCRLFEPAPRPSTGVSLPGQSTDVFTTARPTFAAAVDDFLGRHPTPVQPLEFPHVVHVRKNVMCTEYCHEGVTTGAVAGLPSIRTCMICHRTIATDRPRIQHITALRDQGRDLTWQRVFDYPETSHVRFNHAPHVRAGVECATCHGAIAQQTVAQRNVEMTMGFCVNCHNARKAPTDCLTCHY